MSRHENLLFHESVSKKVDYLGADAIVAIDYLTAKELVKVFVDRFVNEDKSSPLSDGVNLV